MKDEGHDECGVSDGIGWLAVWLAILEPTVKVASEDFDDRICVPGSLRAERAHTGVVRG
jgi:hypothetical protein